MGLNSYFHIVYATLLVYVQLSTSLPTSFNSSDSIPCPDYGDIEFGTIKRIKPMDMGNLPFYAIHIECNPGYELVGNHKLLCADHKWETTVRPRCVAQCVSPPDIENGRLSIEGERDILGKLRKGTLAIYSCNSGYKLSPPESKYRVCEKGIWTGPTAACVSKEQLSCKRPRDIENGYYVQEKMNVFDGFGIGQRLHFSCNSGYVLDGPSVQQCLDDGSWSPRLLPSCSPEITGRRWS